MTNVSKRLMKKEVFIRINNQFREIVSNLKSSAGTQEFMSDFLTRSEELMLSKRLSIIFMLNEDIPFGVVTKTLKVSPTTVTKIGRILDRGGYQGVLKEIRKKKNREFFWAELEVLFRMGMPPIVGKGRWKNFHKNYKNK